MVMSLVVRVMMVFSCVLRTVTVMMICGLVLSALLSMLIYF